MQLPLERIFYEREQSNTWKDYYHELRKRSAIDSVDRPSKAALNNRRLNRYSDVLPYDKNRVVLHGAGDCNYINASHVVFKQTGQSYIIAQGPMEFTCHHFWHMIWEEKVSNIIMLCKTMENQKSKCAQYWPFSVSKDVSFENFSVSLITSKHSSEFDISTLVIRNLNEKSKKELSQQMRTINHFHYHAWPDFGIPDSPDSFLKFLCLIRQQQQQNGVTPSPPVLHCSAGIGRSGVYAVCDIVIRLLENLPPPKWHSIDFDDILLSLRQQRMGLIQAPDQLRFTFKTILRAKQLILDQSWPSIFLNFDSSDEEYSSSGSDVELMPEPPPPLNRDTVNGGLSPAGDSRSELRLRKQQETASKLAEIKVKMKQNENRQMFWNTYWPHLLGMGVMVLGSCAFLYFRH